MIIGSGFNSDIGWTDPIYVPDEVLTYKVYEPDENDELDMKVVEVMGKIDKLLYKCYVAYRFTSCNPCPHNAEQYKCNLAELWDVLSASGLKYNDFLVMWYRYSYQLGAVDFESIGKCIGLPADMVSTIYNRAYRKFAKWFVRHMNE